MLEVTDALFVQEQKNRLLENRNRIVNFMQADSREDLDVNHDRSSEEGDLAQKELQHFTGLSFRARDIKRLREIDHALEKIRTGSYGLCEETGEPIELGRLRCQPWARHKLEIAEEMERNYGHLHPRLA